MVFSSVYPDCHPDEKYDNSLSLFYWSQLDKFSTRSLFVDYASGREWRGQEIKDTSAKLAAYLIEELKVSPGDNCVLFYKNSDWAQLAALGALFAGCAICSGALEDPEPEHEYMCRLLEPSVVMADGSIYKELVGIRQRLSLNFVIIILNDNCSEDFAANGDPKKVGLHSTILKRELSPDALSKLPVRVSGDAAAYVLLTSGSTGKPKPVSRSHRNSLYVCHCLDTTNGELWDLNESSVLAGHLPLDHGTGTFSIKMTLAKGLKLILMENYSFEMLLKAIHTYAISDCILGSALLHRLMVSISGSPELRQQFDLSSLRNMISVGSPIPSHQTSLDFMDWYPKCSVRQSLGMTECGFVSFVRAADCRKEGRTVGWLLPNFKIKLFELLEPQEGPKDGGNCKQRKELTAFEQDGELFVGGPTVSPGYMGGQRYLEQQRLAFMPDGFYRSFDICQIRADGQIVIKGRCNDILCLGDGWKVLPAEIERVLLEHPSVSEVAVLGIPHPELPTCHAPRAYVVLKEGAQLDEGELEEFARKQLSEPKHLVGGVKLLDRLPRITLGKVDKRSLLMADGYQSQSSRAN